LGLHHKRIGFQLGEFFQLALAHGAKVRNGV
jgi:hypothetical protein